MKQYEIVVITGATAGVGRATVRAFAGRGAHIALLARGEEALAATHNRRREMSITFESIVLMWGNKLFPGFGDWYLSQTGYRSQQTKTPRDPDKPFNLWQPVAGDFGARGSFDEEARERSWFLEVNKHLPAISLIGLAVLGTITALLSKKR